MTWDDSIDWAELGVFTSPSEIWKLSGVCLASMIFFYVQYKFFELVMPGLARKYGGPKNHYEMMPPKV